MIISEDLLYEDKSQKWWSGPLSTMKIVENAETPGPKKYNSDSVQELPFLVVHTHSEMNTENLTDLTSPHYTVRVLQVMRRVVSLQSGYFGKVIWGPILHQGRFPLNLGI